MTIYDLNLLPMFSVSFIMQYWSGFPIDVPFDVNVAVSVFSDRVGLGSVLISGPRSCSRGSVLAEFCPDWVADESRRRRDMV